MSNELSLKDTPLSFDISAPEPEITREGALRTFQALRAEARANGVSDLSMDEIDAEIRLTRNTDQ